MNDRFNKAFADIFGDFKPEVSIGHHKTASRTAMYPGSVGAQKPVGGQRPLIVKSGHASMTGSCLQHKGQP